MIEVLVIGGGPAGAAAAFVLARAGMRVLVVERARFPRAKLCGDTLNPGALRVLEDIGLRADVERRGVPLEGMMVTSHRGAQISARYGHHHALAITRDVLDAMLLQHASDAGARVEHGVRAMAPIVDDSTGEPVVRGAVLEASQGTLRLPALHTIAADGRRSVLALAMGLTRHPRSPRRWAIGAYYEGVTGLSPMGEMHIRPGHYIGVAPLPGGLANACIVTGDRRRLARPNEALDETLAQDPLLADRFARATRVGAVSCLGPLAVDARAAGVPGLLLAGDAAGFVDPMTGDGLRFALRGGMLAADTVLETMRGAVVPAHQRLARVRAREFGWKLRLNRTLRRFVDSELGVRTAAVGAPLLTGLVHSLIRAAGDVPAAGPLSRS